MSRGYNTRRKAKRQQARADADSSPGGRARLRRLIALLPILGITVVLAAVAFLGSGSGSDLGRKEAAKKVDTLIGDLPQKGKALGSPKAPITLVMFADLECPTVKRFVEAYLPSIIETWVRDGTMKIEYRSLQTDTVKERTFFEQETAALSAGRQDKMWTFLLTFLYEQGEEDSGYVNDEFLLSIASQVPGLRLGLWRRDREDPLLSRQVALGVHAGHINEIRSTPSFVIGLSKGQEVGRERRESVTATKEEIESSLRKELQALGEEDLGDVPTLSPYLGGSKKANTG